MVRPCLSAGADPVGIRLRWCIRLLYGVIYLVCELGQSRGAVSAIVFVERGTMEVIVHVPCICFFF